MTVRHAVPPVLADTLDAAIEALREGGLRVSTPRRLTLEMLFAAEEPISAERIAGGLDGRLPSSDLAGVYRNLEQFERLGLVRHFHLGHSPGLYVLASRADAEYLVCDSCGQIRALEAGSLDDARDLIRSRFGYEASFNHFPVVGLCPDCAAAQATESVA